MPMAMVSQNIGHLQMPRDKEALLADVIQAALDKNMGARLRAGKVKYHDSAYVIMFALGHGSDELSVQALATWRRRVKSFLESVEGAVLGSVDFDIGSWPAVLTYFCDAVVGPADLDRIVAEVAPPRPPPKSKRRGRPISSQGPARAHAPQPAQLPHR